MRIKMISMVKGSLKGNILWAALVLCLLNCTMARAQSSNNTVIIVSPNGGLFSNAVTETIASTPSVPFEYSVDGGGWTNYTGPFTIDGNDPRIPYSAGSGAAGATLQVRYFASNTWWTNTYTPATFVMAPLNASPGPTVGNWAYIANLTAPLTITMSTATAGATIVYSLYHDYLRQDPDMFNAIPGVSNVYTGPIVITNRSYLFFEAYKPNYFRLAMAPYYFEYILLQPLSAPLFSPPSGTTVNNSFTVTITEPDAYLPASATDNSTNAQGQISGAQEQLPAFGVGYSTGLYLLPLGGWYNASGGGVSQQYTISYPGTYTAAVQEGSDGETAPTATATYYFAVNELVTTPNTIFNTPLTVQAISTNGNSEYPPIAVYYTQNGTMPTTNSAQLAGTGSSAEYVGNLTLTNTATVIWMATRSFGINAAFYPAYAPQYVTNTYTYMPPVSASPPPGAYSSAINITLTAQGGGITYSLDGANWLNYTNPIHLDGYGSGTAALQASYSGALTNQFVYTFQTTPPQASPPSTNFSGSLVVTATPGSSGGYIMFSVSDQFGSLAQPMTLYTNAITNTGSFSYTFEGMKSGYYPSAVTVVSYVSLKPTVIMVTNLSSLTIYNSEQQGTPWWEIYGGTAPNSTVPIPFSYAQPRQTASMTLVNNNFTYYAYAISTNGGTNLLVVPLTLTSDTDASSVWTGSYNGQGNSETTSFQNSGVNSMSTETNSSTGPVTVQTAQNPANQDWQFSKTPLQPDPLTAQPLNPNGKAWLNAYQDYMISIQGTNSGQYDLLTQLRELPSNDYFTNALTWAPDTTNNLSTTVTSNGYNIYATTEPGEQMVMGGQTVWYQITPAQGGTYMAQVTPYSDMRFEDILSSAAPPNFSLVNPEMTLWEGTNLDTLVLQADSKVPNPSTSVNPYNFPGQVECVMQPSNAYYLRIDASSSPGEYNLAQTFYPLASNDKFADAIPLAPNPVTYDNGVRYEYAQTGGNYGATTEQGEPLQDSHSVWFTITIPNSGHFVTAAASTVPSNNITVFPYIIPNGQAVALTNLVQVPQGTLLLSNVIVYLAVCGDQTEFVLTATNTLPPANDFTTNALVLPSSAPSTSPFFVYDSYSTATDPLDSQIPGANNSIWWAVNPNTAGTLTIINTDGQYPTTYWELFNENNVATAIDSMRDRRTYNVLPNMLNLFKLTVPNANEGDGHLNFLLYPNPTNDNQSDPTPVTSYTSTAFADGLVYDFSINDIDNGTNQPGAPFNHCMWYTWTAPGSGYAQVGITSAVVNDQISLAGGELATNPVPCNFGESLLLAAGGDIDAYTLGIDFRPPPSNDEITNAIPVPLGEDLPCYTMYGTMSTTGVPTSAVIPGAADLWFTYNPLNDAQVAFYVTPASNGLPFTLQVIQENTVIGQQTFTLISQPPLNITFTDTNLATLRVIAGQSNTDFTLSAQSQANNDVFTNREIVVLRPSTQNVSVAGGVMPLTKYTAHIVSDNLNATTEPGEPVSGFLTRDPGNLADRPLWWQVTTPVQGVFSIKQNPASDLLSIEVCTNPAVDVVPHSVYDFFAWCATTPSVNATPSDETVTFVSAPNQTYCIRVDTLLGGTGRVDFNISQIAAPAGDPMETPIAMTQSGGPQTYYWKGQYPYTVGGYNYNSIGTVYGATRESVDGALENEEQLFLAPGPSQTLNWITGQLPLYPAWQTLWHKVTPVTTARYTISYSDNFNPIVLETQQNPMAQGTYQEVDNNAEMNLNQGQTYYFLVDAMVPPAQTFSGNPLFFNMSTFQACDEPIDVGGLQGLNTDINRDCEDSVEGVISFSLTPSLTPANDSILSPMPLTLGQGYVSDSCTEPDGNYFVKHAESNAYATSETDPSLVAADWMGGNGQTIWWLVNAALTGPMYITTSDSQVPAIIKVFPGDVLSGGYLFTNGQATFQALSGMSYLIGMDSAQGTNGMLAFTIYQTPTTPINDNFINAAPVSSQQMCGTLTGSTIQQYESTVGTGSIWYQAVNYTSTNQPINFSISGSNVFIDLYQNSGGNIQNCVPEVLAATNITYTAAPGESDYIRVYTTNTPPSGTITLTSTFSPSWYAAQVTITPPQSFLSSLIIQATAQPPLLPTIYYSASDTTTNSELYTGSFAITNSQTIDFLVQIPNITTCHVTNTYVQLPSIAITPSCVFSNAMQVTAGNVPIGTVLTYAEGPTDGSPPQQQNALAFPPGGITITGSEEIDFTVTADNGYASAARRYTNTVAAPQFTADGPVLTITSATPGASLQVQQAGLTAGYPSNSITLLAMSPLVVATASLAGWQSSTTDYGFVPSSSNMAPIQFVTNSLTPGELDVTLVNTNAGTVTWYSISNNGSLIASTNVAGNASLQLYYTCDLLAYPGTPSLSSVGPQSTLHFTATLAMPQMSEAGGQLAVTNPNRVLSSLYINGVDMGTVSQFTLPIVNGIMDTAYATSTWANTSPTNTFTPQSNPELTFNPPSTNFNSDLTVTVSSGEGTLNLVVQKTGEAAVSYPAAGSSMQVVMDRSGTIAATVELYGQTVAGQTNTYTAQVGTVQYTLPDILPGGATYDSLNPVTFTCVTPEVAYQYRTSDSSPWTPLQGAGMLLQNGTYAYQVMATRDGWQSSPAVDFTCTAAPSTNALVDYVAQYYTIYPGNPPIPAEVTATNNALVDFPPCSYQNFVWMAGGQPAPFLYLSTPGTYTIYHQVVKYMEDTNTSLSYPAQYGPTNYTVVQATYFDWQVVPTTGSSNQLGLVVSGNSNIYDNVYFYMPTYIQSWTNMSLVAIGNGVYYNMAPLRNPTNATIYLIPGNLSQGTNSDCINLMYWYGNTTNHFTMKFRTLTPTQYRSSTNQNDVVVLLASDYRQQNVGVYYDTNTTDSTTGPLPWQFPMTGILGTMPWTQLSNGTNGWMFNSKYNLDSLTNFIPGSFPSLPVYGQ